MPAGFRDALARWFNGYQFVLWAAAAGAATSLHADVIPGTRARAARRAQARARVRAQRAELLYMAYDPENREDVSAVDPRAPTSRASRSSRRPRRSCSSSSPASDVRGLAPSMPCGWFHLSST